MSEVLGPRTIWTNSILLGVALGVAVVIVKIHIFVFSMPESRYACLTTGVCHAKWLLWVLLMFYLKTS